MLDVRDHKVLRAAVLAFKAADRELRNDINRATRETLNPVWRGLIEQRATHPLDTLLSKGARIKAGNPPVAQAATSRRRMRGGLIPSGHYYAVEFGANRDKQTTYQRTSPRGNVHNVTRRTARQLPPRIRTGRIVHPAVKELAPRAASLWVQMIVRRYLTAAEEVY